jgi:2-methylfumaryl-CoA isomerase
VDRAKSGNALYGAYGQDFVTACGNRVMVIGLTDRQWAGLVRTLDMADQIAALAAQTGLDLADEGNRYQARDAISALFAPWFAGSSLAAIAPLMDAAKLTWAPFRSFAQAVQTDPDLSTDNPMFADIVQPGIGRYPVPGSPVTSTAFDRVSPNPAPLLGEHTEAILADVLGLGAGQIGLLMDKGIVAGP